MATPAVRNIAKRENIDINKVNGTGKDGRVTKEDILNFISGNQKQQQVEVKEQESTRVV